MIINTYKDLDLNTAGSVLHLFTRIGLISTDYNDREKRHPRESCK